jgi:molybdopterin converting factor small subunit
MPVKVMIPTPLRAYAGKQESVQLQAATVGEALSALTSQFADLKKHLFTDDGRLRSFVNVYVNDEDIRYLQKDQTPVREGTRCEHRAFDRRRARSRLTNLT